MMKGRTNKHFYCSKKLIHDNSLLEIIRKKEPTDEYDSTRQGLWNESAWA